MCEYCKNVKTGDDYEPILNDKIELGRFGVFDCDVYLGGHRINSPSLYFSYLYENNEGVGDTGSEKGVPINYCPMCGEMLREV